VLLDDFVPMPKTESGPVLKRPAAAPCGEVVTDAFVQVGYGLKELKRAFSKELC